MPLWFHACAPLDGDLAAREPYAPDRAEPTRFALPVDDAARISARIGVDHDPVDQPAGFAGDVTCADYLGRAFPWCYDEHGGTDLVLDGGFDAMDDDPMKVLAGAEGVVVLVEDGNYDRCHADVATGGIDCDGHPMEPNVVELLHADGARSSYWHLQQGSALVAEGDEVACGQPIAQVGSSGWSSFPHLHFQVEVDGRSLDPFAGPRSQDVSWWREQGEDDGLPGTDCW